MRLMDDLFLRIRRHVNIISMSEDLKIEIVLGLSVAHVLSPYAGQQ